MKIHIKSASDAAVKMLHTKNRKAYDRLNARNDAIISGLYNRTLSGEIKGFYLIDPVSFRVYHKSPKNPGYIQLSVGFYRNDELIPLSDHQYENAGALLKDGYSSGNYGIIRG